MPEQAVAVSCKNLRYSYGDIHAVDDVSFEVGAGEVFGLIGPNGAGKTTTIRVLTTLLPPEHGDVSIFGLDVRHDAMRIRHLIGYLPQQLSADAALTGYENVWLFARLFDLPRNQRESRTREVLETMGLTDASNRMASKYSGGMIRRLELAQAMVNKPALLILDEPTIGLDPVARSSVWDHVQTLRAETGMTVLLTTHYMEEADMLCDRVALMHRGKVRAIGTPSDLKAEIGSDATLDDVFRAYSTEDEDDTGEFRSVRSARRTARRLG